MLFLSSLFCKKTHYVLLFFRKNSPIFTSRNQRLFYMEKNSIKGNSVVKSVDMLIRSVQSTCDCLSFDAKRIKPCIESLQNKPMADSPNVVMATKDLVNRLTVADEKLAEAMCLIQDALSSVSIGMKNYKEVK